jgi:transcription elongation factor GreA
MNIPKRKKEENRRYAFTDDCHLTARKVAALQRDLAELERERPQVIHDLQVAIGMGDLSENAAYSDAKGRLMRIDGRLFGIKERLKNAIVIEGGSEDGRVCLGAHVVVVGRSVECAYELVGPQEANPSLNRLSYQSPLGTALMGKEAGETITLETPRGPLEYEIISVE